MKRSARAYIDCNAVRHNLREARKAAPRSKVMAVIKANAYGHGAIKIANALEPLTDGFAVSCISEALELRDEGIKIPILVMQGYKIADELRVVSDYGLRVVIHDYTQLQLLDEVKLARPVNAVIKLDTGMHRLGLPCEQAKNYFSNLNHHVNINSSPWLMTHLACADDKENPYTNQQVQYFRKYTKGLVTEVTIANSAGILGWPETHADWIRPGIMLYGSAHFVQGSNENNLKPVMTLKSPLVAVHQLKKGDPIGYGSTWSCPEDMLVGVVAIGYADGYPRHASSGTPVWINGHRSQLLGRVSMDMIVIDLRNITVKVGDEVELWGRHISVDDVAAKAGTISYELLCNAGNNCTLIYN